MKAFITLLLSTCLFSLSLGQDSSFKSKQKQAALLNYSGHEFQIKGMYDSSLVHYKKSLKIFQSINDSINSAAVLINIGKVHKLTGRHEEGLSVLFEATDMLERCCLTSADGLKRLCSGLTTIASIHRNIGNYDKSLTYYQSIQSLLDTTAYEKLKARNYNNIGNLWLSQGEYLKAQENISKSYKLWLTLDNISSQSITLDNLGLIDFYLEDYENAEQKLLDALDLKRKVGDQNHLARTLNHLGLLYTTIGQGNKGLVYLDEAKVIISKIGSLELMIDNLSYRIEYFKNQGRHKELSQLYQEYVKVNDSLLNKEKIESLAEMQTKYETEKKEQSILNLQTEKELQNAEIQLNRLWITILAIGVILVVVIGLFIYSRFRLENRNKKQIETLMQELHHRVKNNLQLLSSIFSLQSKVIKDTGALEAVKSSENRVNAMAIIHQKLYAKSENRNIDIHEYFTDLIEQLADSYGYDISDSHFSIDIDRVAIDLDKVISLGLIVNEVLSNSFKHTFSEVSDPKLYVTAKQKNDHLEIEIKDNGKGFDYKTPRKSMGLNIIQTLGRQLRATIDWQTNNGVKFNLKMNLS